MTAGARAGVITDTGFIGGDRHTINIFIILLIKKQKQNKINVYSFQKCTLEHVSHTTKAGLHLLSYVGYELKDFREFLTYPLLDFHES